LQHPPEQDVELHTHCPFVVLQACPVPHDAQAAPPAPHCVFDSDP
jgi:hypothetical protein